MAGIMNGGASDGPRAPGTSPQPGGMDAYAGLKTEVYTQILEGSGKTVLLMSPPSWCKVTLRLESAGPVSFGTREDLLPVGSGKGRLLIPGLDVQVVMVPLTRLYVAADTPQRVGIQVEPLPWLFEILQSVRALAQSIGQVAPTVSSMLARILGRR